MSRRIDRPTGIMARLRVVANLLAPPVRRFLGGSRTTWLWVLALSPWAMADMGGADPPDLHQIAAHIATQVAGEDLDLQAFYGARDQRPAWGRSSTWHVLDEALERLSDDGLVPDHYSTAELARQWAQAYGPGGSASDRAEIDLRASRLWLRALGDLAWGRALPAWVRAHTEPLPIAQLALDLEQHRLGRSLERVRPSHPQYRHLRAGLAQFREEARRGGWEPWLEGPALHPGDRGPRVVQLRARLGSWLDPAGGDSAADPQWFDPELATAVRRFQRDHGLLADGIVGFRTGTALRVPVAARIDQLRVNLERARWLSSVLPDTHVLVDIAAQDLELTRSGEQLWRARAIVGRPSRPTPVLRSAITHLRFNPPWTIPPTILREDVMPRVRRDSGYLEREGIEVLGLQGERLDPDLVHRLQLGAFRLRQRPGPRNPLGRVVIRFPNPHLVYLHDTPAAEGFESRQRALSSGCVRVEHALELVYLLLGEGRLVADGQRWSREAVLAVAQSEIARSVDLPEPVPVLLWYRTLRAETDGRLVFLPDIYTRDAALLATLDRPAAR